MNKTPTENYNFRDAFNGFKERYGKFVSWFKNPDQNFEFCQCKFIGGNPEKYVNKWGREQYKVEVQETDSEKSILSGGLRLFVKLRGFIEKRVQDIETKNKNKALNDSEMVEAIGWFQIDRIGSGFNTDYKISSIKKPE